MNRTILTDRALAAGRRYGKELAQPAMITDPRGRIRRRSVEYAKRYDALADKLEAMRAFQQGAGEIFTKITGVAL